MYTSVLLSVILLAYSAVCDPIPHWHSRDNHNATTRDVTYSPMTRVDLWSGTNFFDGWDFFSYADPTHGTVNYLPYDQAVAKGLAYTQNGAAFMRVDAWTNLPYGAYRDSVRISTAKTYDSGLFVLDVANAPYGMGVWPAWWTVGPDWPNNGEIDIFEGVHLGPTNQYSLHSAPGCHIDTSLQSTDSWPVSQLLVTDCGPNPQNLGCSFKDQDAGSYGAQLNSQGGAVFAMLWNSDGVKIWNFPRGAVPGDIDSNPDPSSWPRQYLKANWGRGGCDPTQYLRQHKIVFDITLCGDWAGSTYPGDCKSRVTRGSNFVDAVWKINSVSVWQ